MLEKQYPEPIAGALIFNQEGKLFLMKSHKWKGKYMMPGGHIELGEKVEDALKREIKEETTLDINDIEFICLQEFIFGEEFWKNKHFIFLDFACKTDSTNVTLNDEAQEYTWISLDEVFELPIEPYTKIAIEKYMEKDLNHK